MSESYLLSRDVGIMEKPVELDGAWRKLQTTEPKAILAWSEVPEVSKFLECEKHLGMAAMMPSRGLWITLQNNFFIQ